MDMALPVVNATAAALARFTAAFNAPLARAVVFGVHIDGKPSLSVHQARTYHSMTVLLNVNILGVVVCFRTLGRGRASYCSHSVSAFQEELQTTKKAT